MNLIQTALHYSITAVSLLNGRKDKKQYEITLFHRAFGTLKWCL